ncbi:hypothetical protein Btru_005771 [Bulinus truncatus]|nr:hypothetical protein Btru_005771 [Bulinus truncatus]
MFGVSKKSTKPTTYYALTFCIHVVAFVMMAIGMFTPYWSEITEDLITSNSVSVIYNKGLIVSCFSSTNDCRANANLTGSSKVFFAAFVIGIISIIFGFFILQLFCAGIFIRSCRESNLGVPIAVLSIFKELCITFIKDNLWL